jgi:hypothetical protein
VGPVLAKLVSVVRHAATTVVLSNNLNASMCRVIGLFVPAG